MKIEKRIVAATSLGLICFILVIATFIQLKTTNNSNSTVAQTMEENDLRDQVLRTKEKYDNIYEQLQEATQKLEIARKNAAKDDEESETKQNELKLNNILLGQTDVKGEGIEITVKDGTINTSDTLGGFGLSATDVIVHNSDLWYIVNDLKNAGAEAIEINGERIVSTSAITCEGLIIKINNQKLASPYVIKAIGPVALLHSSLTIPDGYLEIMKNNGVTVSIKKLENISIGKYKGVINPKYIQNIK